MESNEKVKLLDLSYADDLSVLDENVGKIKVL